MYEILEKEDGLWLHRSNHTNDMVWLGPREDRDAIEDAMARFLEATVD